ncbi:caspase family protein [Neobacillus drentensis]|uniref:caspase family protein n=1 Tax=Neobacillus drentensis TaxID=220684 RepID=UPI001F20A855|nr:caspase family protein [Neobacillus drentensis]ULT58714.1 caspase family protein [Neobacillus drentensis]
MNLAILIGVSEYYHEEIDNLTACKNDAILMNSLLKSTNKYDEILLIENDTTSDNVKKQITEFIKKYTENKEKDIEEVFFYYSGHGQVYNQEFHYILSDFDFERLNSTSLNNSELDNLLRNLKPKLAIKLIDACKSGVSYVKEPGEFNFEKIISHEEHAFQNCYFMFSSHTNQNSGATDKISHFTWSFLKAIINSHNGEVRYLDIISSIKDDFAQPKYTQIPYFVSQASYTEVFCNVTDPLRDLLVGKLSLLLAKNYSIEKEKNNSSMTLLEIIQKEAEEYCKTPEEAYELLKQVRETIFNYEYNQDITSLYEVTAFDIDSYSDLPKINVIGEQLSKEEDYFVQIEYKNINVKVEITNPLQSSLLRLSHSLTGTQPEKKYRMIEKEVVSNFSVTEESPFYRIKINLEPRFPNLPGFTATIVAAFSKKELTIFYFYNKCKEVSWKQFVENEDKVMWKYNKFLLKKVGEPEEKNKVEKIIRDFQTYVLEYFTEKYKTQLIDNNTEGGEMLLPVVPNKETEEDKKD